MALVGPTAIRLAVDRGLFRLPGDVRVTGHVDGAALSENRPGIVVLLGPDPNNHKRAALPEALGIHFRVFVADACTDKQSCHAARCGAGGSSSSGGGKPAHRGQGSKTRNCHKTKPGKESGATAQSRANRRTGTGS